MKFQDFDIFFSHKFEFLILKIFKLIKISILCIILVRKIVKSFKIVKILKFSTRTFLACTMCIIEKSIDLWLLQACTNECTEWTIVNLFLDILLDLWSDKHKRIWMDKRLFFHFSFQFHFSLFFRTFYYFILRTCWTFINKHINFYTRPIDVDRLFLGNLARRESF